MSRYVSEDLRRLVAERAGYVCEYCLIAEADTYFGCEVDHIIGLKHGGPTAAANLAYACMVCNRNKGSDLGSISERTGQLVRFYNPRTDQWATHFQIDGSHIKPLTEIGEVTVRIFKLNEEARVIERLALISDGRYPPRS
jgi:hypothetical protein